MSRTGKAGVASVLFGLALLATSCSDSAAYPSTGPATADSSGNATSDASNATKSGAPALLYRVLSVADGDTITVDIDGSRERIRLLGIDAPEVTGAPECFGNDASQFAKGMLTGTSVGLVSDPTQDDRDRYGRLLRYVILQDGTDLDAQLIAQGYAHEYTYDKPYLRQSAYRAAEAAAHSADRGLWSPNTCGSPPPETSDAPANEASGARTSAPSNTVAPGCDIKGNINGKGEKIYHQPGDNSYADTVITESKGERYFCSVADAVAAGWRAAHN
jgi:micrococcal nuclease